MPRLLRGMARTAVVAGTATAVSGRVQRRQAERYATRDANIYAEREQAYHEAEAQQVQAAPAPAPAPTAAAGQDDMLDQLERLGKLHEQGILTDDEFATQKSRILAG
jgi:hypothetical protein